jgi:hypothetical protein
MTMRKLIVSPCVVLLIAAAPGTSAQQATTKQVAPMEVQQAGDMSGAKSATSAPEEKKICKQLPTSGSRLPNRACLTEREWKQVEEDLEH